MGFTVCITVAQNRTLVQILNGSLEVPADGRLTAEEFLGKTVFRVNSEAKKRVADYRERKALIRINVAIITELSFVLLSIYYFVIYNSIS